ncbi:phage tail tube protein [Jhaorihella thermophila]
MARAQGARSQLAAAFETTYGTAPGVGLHADALRQRFARGRAAAAGLGAARLWPRSRWRPIKDAVTADGDITVPLDAEAFGFWLKAAFGAPTTTGTTNKTHTFKSGSWSLPSMAIEVAMPEIPRFAMYTGLRARSTEHRHAALRGLLTADVKLVAQGRDCRDIHRRWNARQPMPSSASDISMARSSGAARRLGNIVSADLTYANNVERIETIRNDGRIDGADPSIAALTGKIDVRFADTTLMDQALNGYGGQRSSSPG